MFNNFSIVELDRSIKKYPIEVKENADNLRDWFIVIYTAQLFSINDRIWYPINLPGFQVVDLPLMASATSGKESAKQNIILLNPSFRNPSIDIEFGSFLENSIQAIFWMTLAKIWSKWEVWFKFCNYR